MKLTVAGSFSASPLTSLNLFVLHVEEVSDCLACDFSSFAGFYFLVQPDLLGSPLSCGETFAHSRSLLAGKRSISTYTAAYHKKTISEQGRYSSLLPWLVYFSLSILLAIPVFELCRNFHVNFCKLHWPLLIVGFLRC